MNKKEINNLFEKDYKTNEAIKYYKFVNPELEHKVYKFSNRGFTHSTEKQGIMFCNFCGNCFFYSSKRKTEKIFGKASQCANDDCKLINCNIEIYRKYIEINKLKENEE